MLALKSSHGTFSSSAAHATVVSGARVDPSENK
jgi:hypothetical protein